MRTIEFISNLGFSKIKLAKKKIMWITSKEAFVLDDHRLFADSFSSLLEKTNVFTHVHIESDADKLISYLIKNPKKEVCLFLDYYLGEDKLSTDIINDIRRLNKKAYIFIVTSVANPSIIYQIKSYHPNGVISKVSGFDVILDCIQHAEQGKTYCCPVVKNCLEENQEEIVVFTERQIEILKCFAEGLTVPETAEKLWISLHTVVTHRRRMMKKANCNSIIALLAYARRQRIIQE